MVPVLTYTGSLVNGIQSTAAWKTFFGEPSGARLGLVTAAQSIGSVAILPFVAILSDRLGRKYTLLSGIIVVIIASIIMAASVNYAMLVVSRVIVGIGGMLLTQPSPMLISELCFPTHRGKYTSLFWTCYYLGAILAAWSTFGTQNRFPTNNWAWRIPSLLQAGYPIIQFLFIWFVPESPRWLIANGRHQEARDILARYHTGGDSNHDLISFEMQEISQAIEMEKQAQTTKWSSLVSTPGNRQRTLIAICVGGFAQWNGVAVCSYFLTLVLDSVGVTNPNTQTLINGLLQIFNFASAGSAAFLVDRLGRRTLFLWSGLGMLLSFASLTACAGVFNTYNNYAAGIAVIAFIFIYFFHYDIAYTPLLFGYTTEIMPYSIRAKGLTVELITIYGSLIVLAFVNTIGLKNIGWHYYIVFDVLLVFMLIISFFLFKETRGYSLEEIAQIFDGPSVAVDSDEILTAIDKSFDANHQEAHLTTEKA